jgi:hypothetical protein
MFSDFEQFIDWGSKFAVLEVDREAEVVAHMCELP